MKKLIIVLALVVLLLLPSAACHGSVDVFFPVQKNNILGQMPVELSGNLELVDGWLRLESSDSDYVLIWPLGFSVHGEGKEIQVLDSDEVVVAIVGEPIRVSGGEYTLEIVESYIGQSLPEDCDGPFWIVSAVING
jgi:hypothetical protein